MQRGITIPTHDITLVRGQGSTVWDDHGKPYLDLLSGTWCNALGHGHPAWTAAVRSAAAELAHVGLSFQDTGTQLGLQKLGEVVPPALTRGIFLSSGSEAVELGLKMARAATGHTAVAVMGGTYLGATAHTFGLSEAGRHSTYGVPTGPVVRLRCPDCTHCEHGDCFGTFPCIPEPDTALAALVIEPVLSGAGVIIPPPGYLQSLAGWARAQGALVLANEVTTGMGRTGRWLGVEHEGVVPDILVLGKVLGGGFPVSAVITTEAVSDRLTHFIHGQSHQNDPFAGRVAAAVISILQQESLIPRAAEIGHKLRAGLEQLRQRHAVLAEVRCLGAMAGISFHADVGGELARQLLTRGFIVNHQGITGCLRLFPPYVLTDDELSGFLSALDDTLHLVAR